MIGLEVGSNARSAKPNLYDGPVRRPTVELHIFVNLFTSNDFKKTASIESDYVRLAHVFRTELDYGQQPVKCKSLRLVEMLVTS